MDYSQSYQNGSRLCVNAKIALRSERFVPTPLRAWKIGNLNSVIASWNFSQPRILFKRTVPGRSRRCYATFLNGTKEFQSISPRLALLSQRESCRAALRPDHRGHLETKRTIEGGVIPQFPSITTETIEGLDDEIHHVRQLRLDQRGIEGTLDRQYLHDYHGKPRFVHYYFNI